jgi:hypothetical protein
LAKREERRKGATVIVRNPDREAVRGFVTRGIQALVSSPRQSVHASGRNQLERGARHRAVGVDHQVDSVIVAADDQSLPIGRER